ncbi:MAG: ATPase [Muribaculaceae bacterium]|nr:ATPase [Muribaculaceae bacterium]
MILIADSGGTKVDWCLVEGLDVISRIKTPGMNAMMLSEEELAQRVNDEVVAELPADADIDRVYFYGAGCIGPTIDKVTEALSKNFKKAKVEVASDLLAAARSLCGNHPGIACILGTGSNTCYYDGEKILKNVPALGYILGDEGSGAVLGRLLISDVFKNQLPESLCKKFKERYELDIPTVVQRVYREPFANRFLASVTPFLLENIEEPAIHRLVLNNFKSFFIRNISQYADFRNHKINVTGSVGWYFKDVLREAADAMDCTLGTVTPSPMEGLLEYHCKKG